MDLTAGQVMRRSIQTVPKSLSLPALERAFVSSGLSGFPVLDNGELVGVVSRADVVSQLNAEEEIAARTSDFYRDAEGFHEIPVQSEAQVAKRVGERMHELTVADVMHTQIHAVDPDQSLRDVACTLVEHDIHRVLVTRDRQLLGLISTADFVRLYAQGRIKPAEIH